MPQARNRPRYPIESVDNALRLVRLLLSGDVVRINDVTQELNVSRSTAHRLLSTLHAHGFATSEENGEGYSIGPALEVLGAKAVSDLRIRHVAHPELRKLAHQVGETSELVLLDRFDVMLVDVVEGTHQLRVVDHLGTSAFVTESAAGIAMLATLTKVALAALLDQMPGLTLVRRQSLLAKTAEAQDRGFAALRTGPDGTFTAVASAITHPLQGRPTAVGIVLPTSRVHRRSIPDLGAAVSAAAHAITVRAEGV